MGITHTRIILSIALLFFGLTTEAKGRLLTPDDSLFNYVGRFDFSNPAEPTCSYTYSTVEAKFWGTQLSVLFTEYGTGGEQGTNYIEVVLDKRHIMSFPLKPGTHEYEISQELGMNFHTVRFIKRTEASVGIIGFNGIKIKEKRLYPIKKKKVKLMVIGDGWSTGYGNELSLLYDIETGYHSKNQDGSITWGSMISDYYRADLHNISCSDAGLFRGENADTSKTMYNRFNRIHPFDTSSHWDHNNYQPTIIYIFLGDLDFSGELQSPSIRLDSASYTKNYIRLISNLLELYPNTTILCMEGGSKSNFNKNGWFNGLYQKKRWSTYTQNVVNIFKFIYEPVYYYSVSNPIKHPGRMRVPWGEDWHPSKPIHLRVAYEIKYYFPLILNTKK